MKTTQMSTYRTLNAHLNSASSKLETLRIIGMTGKTLNKASDDPTAIRPVFNIRKQLSNIDRYVSTMGKSLDVMQATDGQLARVENIMQRAKEIMGNGVNGSLNTADRGVLADELVNLRQELLDAANASVDGKYIFSGYNEDQKPFIENQNYNPALYDSNNASTWPILYQGDSNATSLEISPGEMIKVNLTGNALFMGAENWDVSNPRANQVGAGRFDLFVELSKAETALRSNDQAGMQNSITNLEGAADQNRLQRAQLGNQAARVENAKDTQENIRVDLKQILSRYEDADPIESFNDIIQQETALQAALSVTSRVTNMSILDYL